MKMKNLVLACISPCLLTGLAISQAQSNIIFPMDLWQRSNCTVNGTPTGDVSVMDGLPKTVTCTWDSGDAGMQITLHAGQFDKINSNCQFTQPENSYDVISSVEGDKAASIENSRLNSNPLTFTVKNDKSDPNLNIHFLLNSENGVKTKMNRFLDNNNPKYTKGDTITCTFTPVIPEG